MHKIEELRDRLCEELEKYGNAELNTSAVNIVDTLAHAIKNIDKIMEAEEGYSGGYPHYMDGRSYDDRSYDGRRSYARDRRMKDARGRYSGDYSMDDETISRLEKVVQNAPDKRTRRDLEEIIEMMK